MMKYKKYILISIVFLLAGLQAGAQTSTASSMYTDYQQYFGGINIGQRPGYGSPKTVKSLQEQAAALTDEAPPTINATTLPANKKVLSDEDIYAQRKNSVFIIGKLKTKDSTGSIGFDLTGTAFAIDANGLCVTNYHVFRDIIHKSDVATGKDSIYFILAPDRNVYFIDEILAYSQNNDIAIFKVNTQGRQLVPIPLGKPARVGAAVYCISHPAGYFYYFSKGIVSRNVTISNRQMLPAGYNPNGKPAIRMEITADYGTGSSGGPILDRYGNLIGIVSSTAPIGVNFNDGAGNITGHQQMIVKDTSPLYALIELLRGNR